jgi:hypothetical protein
MRYIFLVFVLNFNICFSHTPKTIVKKIGKIEIFSTSSYLTEKSLKVFILGEYSNLLFKKYKCKKKINIHFWENNTDNDSIKIYNIYKDNSKKILKKNIVFFKNDLDIEKALNVIEYIFKNTNKESFSNSELTSIYNSESSELIKLILKEKVYRPIVHNYLNEPTDISYFFRDNKYFFYKKKINEEIDFFSIDNIIHYNCFENGLLVVFKNKNEIKVIPYINWNVNDIRNLEILEKKFKYGYVEVYYFGNRLFFHFMPIFLTNNRIMCYLIDKDILIQNLDEKILSD